MPEIIAHSQRTLRIHIMRYNPQIAGDEPHQQTFEIVETDAMTLFIALHEIREQQDPSLQFDFVCRAGMCGSCAMLVNGRPRLACHTLTKDLAADITLLPLPGFALIADLSVDTGKWMRALSERLQTWIHDQSINDDTVNVDKLEERMEPALATQLYALDRCIECGCCVAACGTAQMNDDFVGAIGLNKIARFQLDPRDNRNDNAFYQLVGNEDGVFGCMTLLGCEDFCPKELPLSTQIAYLRRKMVRAALW